MVLISILVLLGIFLIIRKALKQEKQKPQSPAQKDSIDSHLEELEKKWDREKEEARIWLESKRAEHGQESAFFAGWSSASKGIAFFDKARVLYVEGVEYPYSSLEDCKLVAVYEEEEDDALFDEMEYEEQLRKRKNDVIGSVVIGSAVGGMTGAAVGAMVAESNSDNFIATYLPRSNASHDIEHYEIKIAFKEETKYVVFKLWRSDELDAQRTFNYLLRIIAQNQNSAATITEAEDMADKLLRVADLVRGGMISDEEFEKIKGKLLS